MIRLLLTELGGEISKSIMGSTVMFWYVCARKMPHYVAVCVMLLADKNLWLQICGTKREIPRLYVYLQYGELCPFPKMTLTCWRLKQRE